MGLVVLRYVRFPGPGTKPVSRALTGRFLPPVPPREVQGHVFEVISQSEPKMNHEKQHLKAVRCENFPLSLNIYMTVLSKMAKHTKIST